MAFADPTVGLGSASAPTVQVLVSDPVRPGETPAGAARRHVAEQTGLPVDGEPVLFWHGFLPGT
jgi:hypothetical protein